MQFRDKEKAKRALPFHEKNGKREGENIGKLAECVLLFKLLALLFLILKEGKRGG